MTIYNPDRWVVLEMSDGSDESVRKVFAGSYGGYLGADTWKLSSGIIKEIENEHEFEFTNESGSIYRCQKHGFGMSGLMCNLYESWQEKIKNIPGGSIRIVDEYQQK